MKSPSCILLFSASLVLSLAFNVAVAQVGGSGTTNYVPKWTATSTLGNSQFFDNGHIGFGTTSPNFAGYGGNSKVLTINSPGGSLGLGVLELATDRVPTDGMEIGDLAVSLSDNTSLGDRRITRLLTLAAGTTANNRGGHMSFRTKANGVSGYPVERMRITDAGNIGIGTSTPGSKLTVAGLVESSTGGFKFPDGTIQTTAGGGGSSPWATSGTNIYNTNTGGVGIGTTNPGTAKLAVEGKIEAREVIVTATNPFPDFVFDENYHLMPLQELESSIKSQKHLPEIPSAGDVKEHGLNLGDMQVKLLKKVEELTLYVIDLKKQNDLLKQRIGSIENR